MSSEALTNDQETALLSHLESLRQQMVTTLDQLRELRGEPDRDPCESCEGTGHARDYAKGLNARDPETPCFFCKGKGTRPKQFPWVVTGVDWDTQRPALRPALMSHGVTWVSIRPCAKEHANQTFLGWLLGDLAQGQMAQMKPNGRLEIGMSYHNPAIFVPALGRVILGCESWWGALESPEDLRTITDADIEGVWYVQALKDLTAGQPPFVVRKMNDSL